MMGSRCRDIRAQAAGLASLGAGDLQRRAAETHAAGCAGCAAALAEGRAAVRLVDAALVPLAPRAEALDRVRDGILALMQRTPAAPPPSPAAVPASRGAAAALCGVLLIEWAVMTSRHWTASGLSISLSAATAGIAALAALVALAPRAAAARPGRRRARVVATLGFLGSVSLVESLLQLRAAAAPPAVAIAALGCTAMLAAAVAPPLLLTLYLARAARLPRPGPWLAIAAGAGALTGQAALRLGCHARPDALHAIIFHTLPMLLVLAAGFALGARRPPALLKKPS